MTKLPDISVGGVQGLKTIDPGAAAAPAMGFSNMAKDLSGVATETAKLGAQRQVLRADTALSKATDNVLQNRKRDYTVEELDEMGVQYEAMDASGKTRETVPGYEVFPEILKKTMSEAQESALQSISMPGYKRRWGQEAQKITSGMLNKAYEIQRKEMFDASVAETEDEINDAMDRGDFVTAMKWASAHPAPEARENAIQAVNERQETDSYLEMMRTGDVDDIRTASEALENDNYSGNLSEDKRRAWVDTLNNHAKKVDAARIAREAHDVGRVLGDLEVGVVTGETTPADVEEAYERYKDHATPAWRTRLLKGIATAQANALKDAVDMTVVYKALAGQGVIDPHGNTDHKKAVDAAYELETTRIANSDHPDKFGAMVEYGVQLARAGGYIPNTLQGLMRGAVNTNLPVDQVAKIASVYNTLKMNSPNSLEFMSDKQKVYMEQIYQQSRSGSLTPDAIKDIRTRMETVPPDVLELRRAEYVKNGTGGGHTKYLQNKMDSDAAFGGSLLSYIPFVPFVGAPPVTTQMQIDFDNKARSYYEMTGDMESAREAAYGDMKKIYGATKVGGPERITRFPIEQQYPQFEVEQLQRDLRRYSRYHLGISKEDSDNVHLISDPITAAPDGRPTYAMFWVNPDDPADVRAIVNNDTGRPARYRPDADRINARERPYEKAERERVSSKEASEVHGQPIPSALRNR